MTKNDARESLRMLLNIVVDTIRAAGPDGVPAGHLYAHLNSMGCSLPVYQQIEAALIASSRIEKDFGRLKAL